MSDDNLNEATQAIREWYYTEIRSMVDFLIEDLKAEKPEDDDAAREWLTERVDEITDAHEYVIYTYKAQCVCLASDNEDAYEDETGEKPPTVETQACTAMRRDVWELLEARSDEWLPSEIDPTDETGGVSP